MDPRYTIIPLLEVPEEIVVQYWNDLIESDLLRHRLCDVERPGLGDAMDMVDRHGTHMFLIFDVERKIVSTEFMLNNFTPSFKVCQIHFSMHPEVEPHQSLKIIRQASDTILNDWGEKDNPSAPYLYALIGIIPEPNKVAWKCVMRSGFKKVYTLPKAHRYKGTEDADAVVLIKERTNGR